MNFKIKYLFGIFVFSCIFLIFSFLKLNLIYAASCTGSWKCVEKEADGTCTTTVDRAGSCGGVASNETSCNSYSPDCQANQCELGGCYWVTTGGGGTGTPTPAPACSCQDVVNSGTYADNCPDDMIGTSCTTDPKTLKRTCNCYTTTHVCNPPGCDEVVSPPSCNISMSYSTIQFSIGSSASLQANVNSVANGSISEIDFSTSNSSAVGLSPASDTTSPYTTTVTGSGSGTSTITASAVMGGSVVCTTSAVVTVTNTNPWWQVKDADIITNGNLTSNVPTSLYFDLVGGGGFPGFVNYSGTTNLTAASVSVKGWLVNSAVVGNKTYSSSYFENNIPTSVTPGVINTNSPDGSYFTSGGVEDGGFYYYSYDGTSSGLDLNISSDMDLGGRKVIVFVKGASVNLSGNISLTKGSGFFMVVTDKNIVVAPSVTSLEGIFVADGSFSSGTGGAKSDSQLHVRGTVAAYGGMNLQRDLGTNNSTTPGELFEYAPDLELLFPVSLSSKVTHWAEIAP